MLSQLNFTISPYNLIFPSQNQCCYALYFQKGRQIIGTTQRISNQQTKQCQIKFQNHLMNFRMINQKSNDYQWTLYKVDQGMEQFVEATKINIRDILKKQIDKKDNKENKDKNYQERANNYMFDEEILFEVTKLKLKFYLFKASSQKDLNRMVNNMRQYSTWQDPIKQAQSLTQNKRRLSRANSRKSTNSHQSEQQISQARQVSLLIQTQQIHQLDGQIPVDRYPLLHDDSAVFIDIQSPIKKKSHFFDDQTPLKQIQSNFIIHQNLQENIHSSHQTNRDNLMILQPETLKYQHQTHEQQHQNNYNQNSEKPLLYFQQPQRQQIIQTTQSPILKRNNSTQLMNTQINGKTNLKAILFILFFIALILLVSYFKYVNVASKESVKSQVKGQKKKAQRAKSSKKASK